VIKDAPEDLQPLDREQAEQLKWYQDVIAEYHQYQPDAFDLDDLDKKAPMIYAQLVEDAEDKTVLEYLSDTTLEDYVVELVNWCHQEIAKLEKRKHATPPWQP